MSQESTPTIETISDVEQTETHLVDTESHAEPEAELQDENSELEAAPEETEEKPKVEEKKTEEDKKFAAKFAALARREKLVKQAEVKAKRREQELEARIKQLEEQGKPKQEAPVEQEPLDVRLQKNPFKVLEEMGLGYETLTRMALNDGKMTPELESKLMKQELESKFQQQLKALEAKLEAKEKADKERQEQEAKAMSDKQQQAAISEFKDSIKQVVESDVEAYELISVEGQDGIELIYNEIAEDAMKKRQEADEMGDDADSIELLSIQEAAQRVEDRLLNEAKKRVELGKIKKLLGAPTTQSKEPVKKPASVTLSNSKQQAQGTKRAFLSDEESKKEAAKNLRWNRE